MSAICDSAVSIWARTRSRCIRSHSSKGAASCVSKPASSSPCANVTAARRWAWHSAQGISGLMSMGSHRGHAALKFQHIDVDCIPVQLHGLARDGKELIACAGNDVRPARSATGAVSRAVHSWRRMPKAPAREGPARRHGCGAGRLPMPDRPAALALWQTRIPVVR